MISIVVARDKNGVIGKDNTLPWHLPADLQYFKSVTIGGRVLMGRNTYDSIGKALPGRDNIVITSRALDFEEGSRLVVRNHLVNALYEFGNDTELFVIGGSQVFQEALPYVTRIYVTQIDEEFEGDTFFHFNEEEWKLVTRIRGLKDEKNPYSYQYLVYEK